MKTFCAPPERDTDADLSAKMKLISENALLSKLYSAIPNVVLILNSRRQTVYYNDALVKILGLSDGSNLLGRRPGEIFNCVHAFEEEGGCGTAEACCVCGAVRAIQAGIDGKNETQECRISARTSGGVESLDLRVSASPLDLDGERFVVFHLADISDEKRRKVLEKIFFHDVTNTAGNIMNLAELISDEHDPSSLKEMTGLLGTVSKRLIGEIMSQRELLSAENGETAVRFVRLSTRLLIEEMVSACSLLDAARGRIVREDPLLEDLFVSTDRHIICRTIGNLLKNAIEASTEGGIVTASSRRDGDTVVFSVSNEGVIPREIQLQLFQRSFSTKGKDRGLGTYSVKLLTQRYLHGSVSFVSNKTEGTVFLITLPLEYESTIAD